MRRLATGLPARARHEGGFGLVELLIAMTLLATGILALFAMFQAGMLHTRRAAAVTTAGALADTEMEKYRAIRYAAIGFTTTQIAGTDATYKSDVAYKTVSSP